MSEDLDEKIYQCASFLRDIYTQVQGILEACDASFDKAGLVPANGSEVEFNFGKCSPVQAATGAA